MGFAFPILACRTDIVGKALETGEWPEHWRSRLLQVESYSWGLNVQNEGEEQGSEETELLKGTSAQKDIGNLESWQLSVNSSIKDFGESMDFIKQSLAQLAKPTPGPGKKR